MIISAPALCNKLQPIFLLKFNVFELERNICPRGKYLIFLEMPMGNQLVWATILQTGSDKENCDSSDENSHLVEF